VVSRLLHNMTDWITYEGEMLAAKYYKLFS